MVIQIKKEVKTTVLQPMVISFPTYTMDGNGKYAYGIFSPTEVIQVRTDNSDIINWKHNSVSNCGIDQAFNGEGNRMIDSATFFAFYDKAIEQIAIEAIDIIKAQVAVQQWKLDELKEKNENLA